MSIVLDKKKCPFSGEEFVPKRRNQVYAKPEYRIAHNNEKGRIKREKTSKLNKILFNNAQILERLLDGIRSRTVHSERLIGMGFSFKAFTHLHSDKVSEKTFYAVYGFALRKIDSDNFKIIRI